jgi:hypothetical protein
MPLTKSPQKAAAQHLYFTTALTQKQIATAVRVTEKTMRTWIKKENWAAQKQALYYSPDQELQQLYEQSRKINERVAERMKEGGIITKEELDLKAKLGALIALFEKNAASWRNIAAEYDFHNPNIIDLSALSALERRNLEKRQQAAEEDARLGPGVRFSEEEMKKYYKTIANLRFDADSSAATVGKDGKPLAEDDPQRLKWEARMRQGKRPFVDDDEEERGDRKDGENGSAEQKSGRRSADGRSNDDLPDGETWMDMPEEEDE